MAKEHHIKTVKAEVAESLEVKKSLLLPAAMDTIAGIAEAIIDAYGRGNKVVWFGNGGSAADAQHLSCELVSTFEVRDTKYRKALRSMSLTTNTSVLTAIGNDFDFAYVFERQVEAAVDKGDVVIGMSTSGTSKNVVTALKKAKEIGAVTVGFTGQGGGDIKKIADITLEIPSRRTRMIQEAHMTAGHTICSIVEMELFPKK